MSKPSPPDAAGTNQLVSQPEPAQSHTQYHSPKKKNRALHLPDIPEEGKDRTDRMRRSKTATEKGYIKLECEHDDPNDNPNDDPNDGDRDSDGLIDRQSEPEHKHEYEDEHKHELLKLFIQDGSDLPIQSSSSSSSSSQNTSHLHAHTSLSNVFPDDPFGHHQHHPHGLSVYPSSTGLSVYPSSTASDLNNASSYESGYGSIDNIDNDRSMSISVEQTSDVDQSTYSNTSFDTSDATSLNTVKIRNSMDEVISSSSSKHHHHHHHHNNYGDDNFDTHDTNHTNNTSHAVPTTITQPRSHNTRPRDTHRHTPLSPSRKSKLNDLAHAAKLQHRRRQQQHNHLSEEMRIDSNTSLSCNISNNNDSISSETMPILPTTHRHHNNNNNTHHHKKNHHNNNHNRQQRESLHRIHKHQRSVSERIGSLKPVEQPLSYRDIQFSLLFFAQLCIMIGLALNYGSDAIGPAVQTSPAVTTSATNAIAPIVGSTPAALKQINEQLLFTCQHVIMLASCSGLISIVISTLALIFMTLVAEKLVEIALYVAISLALAWGTIGTVVLAPHFKFVPITGLALLGLITAYAFVVWDRIPFASANLKTALTAIRSRPGVVAVAFALQVLALVWAVLMMFTVVGIYNSFHTHVTVDLKWRVACYVGLGISFYWHVQLLLYMVHVTVAGIVKNWWFNETSSELPPTTSAPPSYSNERHLNPCQNEGEAVVTKSFQRAVFHSFGSVCFGSLLVSFVRLLRRIPKYIHPCSNRQDTLQDRFMSCMDALGSKFNRFAFIYVGMYGYGFVEAGEKASTLLKKRGWKKIVTDNLISDVLLLVSLVIGGVSGCLTVWIESVGSSALSSINHPTCTSFLIGYTIGLVLSSILFGIISSSVNAVIILFAGNPVEFEENHPELSHEMRAAWKEVFPGKVDSVVTTRSTSVSSAQDFVEFSV
eukprot:CAMPEP_0198257228 /NCGR_PEP_ID=MMETSP1447-20131203/6954_1 /TAXON_ID=420782 /ORGANISM="Chaetoceros dichaeta, Strain CCMP1751" /LENGTH=933 /DNA_ID=CAMNT_0043944073 /DNA_START=126 /DNA_END=2927 /DNA_ORIENTATION=+